MDTSRDGGHTKSHFVLVPTINTGLGSILDAVSYDTGIFSMFILSYVDTFSQMSILTYLQDIFYLRYLLKVSSPTLNKSNIHILMDDEGIALVFFSRSKFSISIKI